MAEPTVVLVVSFTTLSTGFVAADVKASTIFWIPVSLSVRSRLIASFSDINCPVCFWLSVIIPCKFLMLSVCRASSFLSSSKSACCSLTMSSVRSAIYPMFAAYSSQVEASPSDRVGDDGTLGCPALRPAFRINQSLSDFS